MLKPHVYLDLDRTLFQTGQIDQMWHWLAKRYPDVIDEEYELTHRADFYVHQSEINYYHDLTAHLQARGLDAAKVYSELRSSELADGRLGFAGLDSLITYLKATSDVAILTFGADDYQRLKASLLPALRDIPIVTTLEDKVTYFREHHDAVWLVDDKPLGDTLPEWVKFVQVSLEKPSDEQPRWPLFGSLSEVEQYFRNIFSKNT